MSKAVPLIVIIILVHIFLIFNADLAFGVFAETARNILLTYLLVVAAITAIFDVKPFSIQVGAIGLQYFVIGFVMTALLLLLVSPLFTSQAAGSISTLVAAVSLGFMYAFVIAYDEEIIFRDLLPKKLHIPDLIAQPLFGLFHAAALSAVLAQKIASGAIQAAMFWPLLLLGFAVLTALGFMWAFMRDRITIYGSTGSHFAYNAYAQGVLGMLIGISG